MRRPARIAELVARHKAFNIQARQALELARQKHPDIDGIFPQVLEVVGNGRPCPGCGGGCVYTYDRAARTRRAYCADAINALRLDSLRHSGDPDDEKGEVCTRCDVKYDDYGFVVGAVHHMVPRGLLLQMLAARRVFIEESGEVTIKDLPVQDLEAIP